ncbi:hypothetical protein GC167_02080 [bacterium]|nr:hypothetical protein [bacterium]
MKGWMYILECSDGSYYTGSTIDLDRRINQHQSGQGANHTKKRLPVVLVYSEEYPRIAQAFYREKEVQGWNRQKKEALILGQAERLPELSLAYRDKEGAFESLRHPNDESLRRPSPPLPEALEGNGGTKATEERRQRRNEGNGGTKAMEERRQRTIEGNAAQKARQHSR